MAHVSRNPFGNAQGRLNQHIFHSHVPKKKSRAESAEAKEHIELVNAEWQLRQEERELKAGVKKLNEDIAGLKAQMATKDSRIDNLESQIVEIKAMLLAQTQS